MNQKKKDELQKEACVFNQFNLQKKKPRELWNKALVKYHIWPLEVTISTISQKIPLNLHEWNKTATVSFRKDGEKKAIEQQ